MIRAGVHGQQGPARLLFPRGSLEQLLQDLETKLMDPEVRRSEKAAEFIADDFMEFAGNGRVFNKSDALAMMKRHVVRTMAIEEFNVRELAPNVVLVTYRVRSQGFGGTPGRISVRSSIWVQRGGKWQVTFHQATLIAGAAESV
jgi:hypothetical protein